MNGRTSSEPIRYIRYGNLKVTEEGGIYDIHERPIPVKNGTVKVYVEDKKRTLLAGRVVYEAVTEQEIPKGSIIRFADGNKDNCAYQNIVIIDRKDYFGAYDWDEKKKISVATREKIKKEYNKEERERHNYAGEWAHPSLNDLRIKYGCSLSTIQKIVNGTY